MRITIIGHHVAPIRPPFAGGVESMTWYHARWLARRGHQVTLHALPGSEVPGVDVRELAMDAPLSDAARHDVSMPPAAFMAAHQAYQALLVDLARGGGARREAPDVVQIHTLHYVPVLMAHLLPVPALLTLHTPPTPWLEAALRALPDAEHPALAAVSPATRHSWKDVVEIRDVVRNGIDLNAWTAGPGGTDCAWSGRIVPEKAPHLAIDAARAARLPIRLCGPIIDRAYWEREVAPRLGDDARYLGHLEHGELARVLGRSRVAVMTPQWDEPFGLAAAEALATGTPVASFARGGLPEVIGAEAGRLAATEDVAALARALTQAAALPRAQVRAYAVAHLGLDAMGAGYERIYKRLLRHERAALGGFPAPIAVP